MLRQSPERVIKIPLIHGADFVAPIVPPRDPRPNLSRNTGLCKTGPVKGAVGGKQYIFLFSPTNSFPLLNFLEVNFFYLNYPDVTVQSYPGRVS